MRRVEPKNSERSSKRRKLRLPNFEQEAWYASAAEKISVTASDLRTSPAHGFAGDKVRKVISAAQQVRN